MRDSLIGTASKEVNIIVEHDTDVSHCYHAAVQIRAQLFEGRSALNPWLNLTRVFLSCVQKHFLG